MDEIMDQARDHLKKHKERVTSAYDVERFDYRFRATLNNKSERDRFTSHYNAIAIENKLEGSIGDSQQNKTVDLNFEGVTEATANRLKNELLNFRFDWIYENQIVPSKIHSVTGVTQ